MRFCHRSDLAEDAQSRCRGASRGGDSADSSPHCAQLLPPPTGGAPEDSRGSSGNLANASLGQRRTDVRRLIAVALLAGASVWSCSAPIAPVGIDPASGSADLSPTWSPLGDSIAYIHIVGDATDSLRDGIYMIGAGGGGRRLVREGFTTAVAFSPDGRKLVFATPGGLFTCTAVGDSVEQIFVGTAFLPSWSPSGSLIAFDDVSHVWLIPSIGGDTTCVTSTLGGGRDPDWSPDGMSLVMRAPLPGGRGGEVAVVSLTGQLLGRVTTDENEDRAPAWAPSGSFIAWNRWLVVSGTIRPEFWIADTSGATARRLRRATGTIDWSPDGSSLVYSAETSPGSRLFVIGVDGSGERQLTR